MRYVRNMQGYGANPPAADWPGGARIAVQFVLNYEEGGENCVLHGDAASEAFLSEIVGARRGRASGTGTWSSIYEYGARAGFWRLHRLFTGAASRSRSTASPRRWRAPPSRWRRCRRRAGRSRATG